MSTSPRGVGNFRVLKFGGTSVTGAERLAVLCNVVLDRVSRSRPVVVVSAFSGVTDRLVRAAKEAAGGDAVSGVRDIRQRHAEMISKILGEADDELRSAHERDLDELARLLTGVSMVGECSRKSLDAVLSFGERLSSPVVSAALVRAGVAARPCDARQILVTDDRFGDATVDLPATRELATAHFTSAPEVQVVTGFIGATTSGETTTTGRGGSDYTATVLGAVLDAEAVEIWTDVPGVMSADPREVETAFALEHLTFDELVELSHWGAKVMQSASTLPLRGRGIPLQIRSSLVPDHPGTLVTDDAGPTAPHPVSAVTSITKATLVQIHGEGLGRARVLARVFVALAGASAGTLFVSQGSSAGSVCLALRPDSAQGALGELEEEFRAELLSGQLQPFDVENNCAIVAVVGEGMRHRPGIAGRVFGVLGRRGINIRAIAQGSSELNISFAVDAEDRRAALRTIHGAFFGPRQRPAELYIAGTGRVGSALLRQIAEGRRSGHDLVVCALSRSKNALLAGEGIDLANWEQALDAGTAGPADIIEDAIKSGRHPRIFVDLTASDAPVAQYERMLRAGVAVVSANKVGFCGDLALYRRLLAASRDGAKFYHETTVAAGLPVLGTLADLVDTGDRIEEVDGMLSGTLGFLFGRIMAGAPFSDAVREAYDRGLTEPDPRVDLSGKDVARKLVILARQVGLDLEIAEVEVEPLFAGTDLAGIGIDQFWKRLPELDERMEKRRCEAEAEGTRLVYLARLRRGRASVRIEKIGPDHQCWGLTGPENLVAIRSHRYREHALVVRGPGAGPEVTAAGVYADILRASAEAKEVQGDEVPVPPSRNA